MLAFEPRAAATASSTHEWIFTRQRISTRPSSASSNGSAALHPCRSLLSCPASARGDLSPPAWPTDVILEPEHPRVSPRVVRGLKFDERPTSSPCFRGRDAVSGCSRCRVELGQRVKQLQRELAACQQARLAADHRASSATANFDAAMAWQRDLLRGLRELGAALPDERDGHAVTATRVVDAVRDLLRRGEGGRTPGFHRDRHQLPACRVSTQGQVTPEDYQPLSSPTAAQGAPQTTVEHALGGNSLDDDGVVCRAVVPPVASISQSDAVVSRQQQKPKTHAAPSATAAGLAVTRFQLGPMLAKMASASAADTMRQHAASLPTARAPDKLGAD